MKIVEKSAINETFFQVRETEVRDHAKVLGYQVMEYGTITFEAGPMDIFLFCVKQSCIQLYVPFIPHPLELCAGESIFLAYPMGEWNVRLSAEASTELFVIQMEASAFHKILNPSFDEQKLETGHRVNMKDLMRIIPVSPSMMSCFDQLLYHKLNPPFGAMFEKAKFLEIFSQILESSFGQPLESCPVAMSPAIESKLNKVRRHIIDHVGEAPDPDRLAVLYDLPRNTLREGYRFIYGKTIHQFHSDHKLESAMQMLNSGELLVKEVAFKIGYQNPSHFISAFKKKYGYTPKQYFKKEGLSTVQET